MDKEIKIFEKQHEIEIIMQKVACFLDFLPNNFGKC